MRYAQASLRNQLVQMMYYIQERVFIDDCVDGKDDEKKTGWSAIGFMLIWNPSSIFSLTKNLSTGTDDESYSRNRLYLNSSMIEILKLLMNYI